MDLEIATDRGSSGSSSYLKLGQPESHIPRPISPETQPEAHASRWAEGIGQPAPVQPMSSDSSQGLSNGQRTRGKCRGVGID
ncbi:hypothetical protein CDL15_Pgr018312 [Punica granatum]|uniref:Uncharacterized protein n=1 Tax=Punica granatum TaxID=22663 RepID=A0A218WHX0_PUNGR|nr:hypothetical protein CDL15_Pgr018312 [Punica granatum]PKI76135.1 hypothetical protein CRG98_003496 [Punica granatum]